MSEIPVNLHREAGERRRDLLDWLIDGLIGLLCAAALILASWPAAAQQYNTGPTTVLSFSSGNIYPPSGLLPVTDSFVAASRSKVFSPYSGRPFNFYVSGAFTANCRLERSYDRGGSWWPLSVNGTNLESFSFVNSTPTVLAETWEEDVPGLQYSLNCPTFGAGSGQLNVRFEQ